MEAAVIENADERRWFETLESACERVLAEDGLGDRSDPHYAALLEDVAVLLARIRADLADEHT